MISEALRRDIHLQGLCRFIKKCGVTSGLVSLGGNVQLLGAKPDGSAWKVAVESPDEDGNYLGILQAKDKAVITSGGYERYFEKTGRNITILLIRLPAIRQRTD